MPIGDRRYRMFVSREAQAFIAEHNMEPADSWHRSGEYPPYYPDSVRAIVFGEDLPEDLAMKLQVPVDLGRTTLERVKREQASSEQTGNAHSHNGH